MAKDDFLPRKDVKFLAWHDQFKNALGPLAASLGITPEELAAVVADNDVFRNRLKDGDRTNAAALAATSEKRTCRRAVETNVRKLARRIKLHRNYTAAIGTGLGIEGSDTTPDLSDAKPTATATTRLNGAVEIDFVKGDSEGVNIYSKREGDSDFVFLARDTYTPYLDSRPLLAPGKPELREYQLIYVQDDEEIGKPSNIITATARP